MLKPLEFGFTETFTLHEQYQILADLIMIARQPERRAALIAQCRIPDGIFKDILRGNVSAWSARPAEPLFLASRLTLNRLYDWFRFGFKPTPAEMIAAYSHEEHQAGGHLTPMLVAALWLWFEQTLAADLPGLAPSKSAADIWRLRIQPLRQTLVTASRHTSAILVTIADEQTGHLLAYRILPATQRREGRHWALHDALALQKRQPAQLLVEEFPPTSVTTALRNLALPYRCVEVVPPYWQEWDVALKARVFAVKQLYRVFGLYVERQQRQDPFRHLLQTYDVFRRTSHDPAWENATLRLALPASKTAAQSADTLRFAGHPYYTYGNAPSLLPRGTPVTLRLSAFSANYGWVYHAKKLLTKVFRADTDADYTYLHHFRDWE